MKLDEILDDVKRIVGAKSDGDLGRALGIDKRRISEYYKGNRTPDEFACLKIAEATGKPLNAIIAQIKSATEKDETRREAWENYMKRLGGLAASIMGGVVFVMFSHISKAMELALLSA